MTDQMREALNELPVSAQHHFDNVATTPEPIPNERAILWQILAVLASIEWELKDLKKDMRDRL